MENEEIVVQKQATVGDIIEAHISGMGGYEIADKYGVDPEKVKMVIARADAAGKFIPEGVERPVDMLSDLPDLAQPLDEGINPVAKTSKTATTNTPV